MRIYFIGFMGSGKTYWGKQLSEKLNVPFFDLDEKIVEDAGQSINEMFKMHGEEYFRVRERDVLHQLSEKHKTFVMACGGGTPCFYNNIDYLKKSGIVIWLSTSTETLFNRLVKEKEDRPLISDYSDNELKSYIIKKYSSRKIYYRQANFVINEEQLSLDAIMNVLFHP
jgi:Shikimate kinase